MKLRPDTISAYHHDLLKKWGSQLDRAPSWESLFPSDDPAEAAKQDYLESIVANCLLEHSSHLQWFTIRTFAQGELFTLCVDIKDDDKKTVLQARCYLQRNPQTGNVRIAYERWGEKLGQAIITPYWGNRNHDYTDQDTQVPIYPPTDELLWRERIENVIGHSAEIVTLRLLGKPATEGWELTMLQNDEFPQRIGHKIYPLSSLQAQRKLKVAYPQLFPVEPNRPRYKELKTLYEVPYDPTRNSMNSGR